MRWSRRSGSIRRVWPRRRRRVPESVHGRLCVQRSWHKRGCGPYFGREGLHDLGRKVMEITGATFQEEVEDVLVNDRHAVVLARHRFTRDGVAREYWTAHEYNVENGKLARCFEQPRDPAAFDSAWEGSAAGVTA